MPGCQWIRAIPTFLLGRNAVRMVKLVVPGFKKMTCSTEKIGRLQHIANEGMCVDGSGCDDAV